jgi:hypothetical protein
MLAESVLFLGEDEVEPRLGLLLFFPKVQYFLEGSLEEPELLFSREGVDAGGVGGSFFSAETYLIGKNYIEIC